MLEAPTQLYGKEIGTNYQRQTETLGKHFRLPNRVATSASGGRGRNGPQMVGDDQLNLLDPNE